jgi:hypothetical protein
MNGLPDDLEEADFLAPHIWSSHASQGPSTGPVLTASVRSVGQPGTVYVEAARVAVCPKCKGKRLDLQGPHAPHWDRGRRVDCSGDEAPV